MTCYCKHCMIPSEEPTCPNCGAEKLWVILPEDPCYLTEQQMLWAGVLEDVLNQRRIPHMKRPVYGAGLTKTLGGYHERYEFFVPYEYLPAAREIVAELFSQSGEGNNPSEDPCEYE